MAGVVYYSTGKGKYLRTKGAIVSVEGATAEYLLEKGFITESEPVVEPKEVVQQEQEVITESEPVEKAKRGRKPKQ